MVIDDNSTTPFGKPAHLIKVGVLLAARSPSVQFNTEPIVRIEEDNVTPYDLTQCTI